MVRNLIFQARYACLFGLFLLPSYAALITYSDRPTFNGAAPGLPTETFSSGLVNPASVTVCNGPLRSTSGDVCFPAGGLLPGVVYSSTSGPMAVIGAGFAGLNNASNLLGPNNFGDTLDLAFTQTSAAGFDLFASPQTPGSVSISVYSTANALLGDFTVTAPLTGTFFGVFSNTGLIGRIDILSQAALPGEVITNLSFGVPTATTPEPGSLLLSGAGLVGMILWRRAKRSLRH